MNPRHKKSKKPLLRKGYTAAAGVAAAVALAGTVAAPAHAAQAPQSGTSASSAATPYVVGGERAKETPYIVQLEFEQNGATYGCTGEAINSEWVLTAQHCTDGDTAMNVYYSNDTNNQGDPVKVDKFENSPDGDVGLVHLSKATTLSEYAPIGGSYTPKEGDEGDLYGYGLRANKRSSDGLYTAHVSVLGESTDAYNGPAIHVEGVNGASNHGDSGGPLIINGKVVGVCSTGDSADPGSDIHAGSNYANLTASMDWINETSGGAGDTTPTEPTGDGQTPTDPGTDDDDWGWDDWSDSWGTSWDSTWDYSANTSAAHA